MVERHVRAHAGLQELVPDGICSRFRFPWEPVRPISPSNMVNFYDYVRKNDKVLTHTLVNPQISHDLAKEGKYSDKVALHIVKETDAGMVVRGARLLATLGPHADEIEVFPSTLLKASEENHSICLCVRRSALDTRPQIDLPR